MLGLLYLNFHNLVKKYYAQKSVKAMKDARTELHILWTEDVITKTKNKLERCHFLLSSVSVSLSFLFFSCVMCHISGCKQSLCQLRTGLVSLCRHQELSHPFRWHIRLVTQTHTFSQTFPKPAQPSGYWKDISPWSSWLIWLLTKHKETYQIDPNLWLGRQTVRRQLH